MSITYTKKLKDPLSGHVIEVQLRKWIAEGKDGQLEGVRRVELSRGNVEVADYLKKAVREIRSSPSKLQYMAP